MPGPESLVEPLTTVANAAAFIRAQRGTEGHGLPASFRVPVHTTIPNPLRKLIVSEGVGLYDTSLAIIVLLEAGDFSSARELLDIYRAGVYSDHATDPMELRAMPSHDNDQAFAPFNHDAFYFFDFTNVHGNWLRWGARWSFWSVHTGPNAWLLNALCRWILVARHRGLSTGEVDPYLQLAEQIATAMARLQDPGAQGGIRYGPQKSFHEPDTSDPFLEINSENNISAYAALQLLYRVTGNQRYAAMAAKIVQFLTTANVWTRQGVRQKGLYNPKDHAVGMGVEFHGGRWVLQEEHPTDSGGTWTLSSLGPSTIDALWGSGTAYQMWRALRSRAGRTADFTFCDGQQPLAGLDYTDAFPPNESLISPEWTAGGLYAVRALLGHYGHAGALTDSQLASLQLDAQTMRHFLLQNSNAYAFGPGHGGTRQGQTGFHWYCPPPSVVAMASVFVALVLDGKPDPLGVWRLQDLQ